MKCSVFIAALPDGKPNFETPFELMILCVKTREFHSVTQILGAHNSKTLMRLQPETWNLMNFAFSSNNKDQLRDLYNYLNQKVVTVIDTLDGSKLGDNLITSHQVGRLCVLSAHSSWSCWKWLRASCSNKVGSTSSLVL